MPVLSQPRARTLTVVAQDPSIRRNGRIVTTRVSVPAERLKAGPWGHRVHVVDYDASTGTLYKPLAASKYNNGSGDPFAGDGDGVLRNDEILDDPRFHCQNVYALVMRTLARFEYALGRRVSWSFGRHQLKVVPHAFADANAFYSEQDETLLFGYFPGRTGKKLIYTCLSHDVVVHETTHALVDGLRDLYTEPSFPDQPAFHEGFADIVALLSVFSLEDVVDWIVAKAIKQGIKTVRANGFTREFIKDSGLLKLAEQLGSEISLVRGRALRHSIGLEPSEDLYDKYQEPHRRGEVLVAAVMNAFVDIWVKRVHDLGAGGDGRVPRERLVEEGSVIAEKLLTIAIRALDYCPPVDIDFRDFLSALLTADKEVYPDDSKYGFRNKLLGSFASYGVKPPRQAVQGEGTWKSEEEVYDYSRVHFESMRVDPDEIFSFIWENRRRLTLCEEAHSQVISVRPVIRIGHDGFMLHETVAECIQTLEVQARELPRYDLAKPASMPDSTRLTLYGGTTLIFDEYGRLKYRIHNGLVGSARQSRKIRHLWKSGMLGRDRSESKDFARIHRERAISSVTRVEEGW